MPPRGVKSAKLKRQYEHIKESELGEGRSPRRAKQIAAATVNKQRARSGQTKTAGRKAAGAGRTTGARKKTTGARKKTTGGRKKAAPSRRKTSGSRSSAASRRTPSRKSSAAKKR
jgi:hypothetical protein